MEDRKAKMGGFFGIMMIVGMAVTGVAAGTGVNGTLAEGNGDTLRLLLGSSDGSFTVEKCVESVKNMKTRRTEYSTVSSYASSFPPEDFVPPGAEEWCRCLEADPSGIASLSAPDIDFRDEAQREPFEQAFDRCRGSILDGSDFHTADICRGMLRLFGQDFSSYHVTFCARICRSLEGYDTYDYYREDVYTNLSYGCSLKCLREAMPGYCKKYKVWYSEWEVSDGYFYIATRGVGVGEEIVATQRLGLREGANKRSVARSLCNALHPLLGGNINECCNYARTFGALEDCCALDSDGFAIFDCEKNFSPASLYSLCRDQAGGGYPGDSFYGPDLCRVLRDADLANSQIWKQSGTEYFLISLPDSVPETTCYGRYDSRCCFSMTTMNISAECVDPSTLTYVGRVTERLDGPTPAAMEEKKEDPCLGLCEDGRECVLTGNGSAFCVDCTAFLKPKTSGDLAECCTYDSDKRKCVSALENPRKEACQRSEEIFILADEGSRQPVQFKRSGGFACASVRDFRRNGAACKVLTTPSGRAKCFE